MCEILYPNDPERVRDGSHSGEPLAVRPNGFAWGDRITNDPKLRIVRITLLSDDTALRLFNRDGVPLVQRQSAQALWDAWVTARATYGCESPEEQAAHAAWRAGRVVPGLWPSRRFHTDLAQLSDNTPGLIAFRNATRRKDLSAYHALRSGGGTVAAALAAAIAGQTNVTDFTAALTED